MSDSVNSPSHYVTSNGLEVIEMIEAILGPEGFYKFCKGNVIKYVGREGKKGPAEEDLEKAGKYLGWMIKPPSEST